MRQFLAIVALFVLSSAAAADDRIVITDFENPLGQIAPRRHVQMVLDCRIDILSEKMGVRQQDRRAFRKCVGLVESYDSLNGALAEIIRMRDD